VRPSFDCLSWFLNKRDLTIIQIGWGAFDFFSQVSKVNIEEDYSRFNFCQSFRNQIQDIYIIDKDSSLKPPGSQTRGASSIVSDWSNALQFIPEEKRTHVDGLCYQYCEDTCLRTMIFSVNPADTREFSLRVCERGKLDACVIYSGNPYYEPLSTSSALSFVVLSSSTRRTTRRYTNLRRGLL
jgi:hypothetical protein